MSAVLKFLGGLAVILVLGGAAGWYKAMALQRDGVQYVETNVPQIVANWDADDLVKRAAPEFLVPQVREGFPKLFQELSRIGKLRNLGKPKGNVTIADFYVTAGDKGIPMPETLEPIWARYVVDAEFDTGSFTIMMDLLRRDGRWQIAGFFIKPDGEPR